MKEKEKLNKQEVVPVRTKFGYTIGAIGDSSAYNIVISFLSFFLTTVAGIDPAMAGSIVAIAIVWDAITDPLLGMMIDNSKNKKGKRRPFIFASLIPLSASIVFLFLNVNLPQPQKNIYYLIVVLIFWTAYTVFNIPYYSMGSVITTNEDERTKIAGWREVMGFIGIFAGTSVPTYLVGKFLKANLSTTQAWFYAAIVVAIITFVTIFIMWKMTEGEEPIDEQQEAHTEKLTFKYVFQNIKSLMKTRAYIAIIFAALFFNIFMTIFYANVMYYTTYIMNVSEESAAILFTVMNICSIALIPFIAKAALHIDKKIVYIAAMSLSGISMVVAKFTGLSSVPQGIIYVIVVSIGITAYWMFIFNFLYDVVDLDEFKTGQKRDGLIMSYYSFLLKLGGALASFILGLLMKIGGFNPELATQSATAIATIESLFTIYPGVFMLFSGAIMLLSPITKKQIEALRIAQERKDAGLDYSTAEFENLLK